VVDVAVHVAEDLAATGVAALRLGHLAQPVRADVAQERVDRVRPRPGGAADRRADPLGAGEVAAAQPPPLLSLAVWIGPRRKTGPGRAGLPFASRVTSTSR
jgi:hypothetical protein